MDKWNGSGIKIVFKLEMHFYAFHVYERFLKNLIWQLFEKSLPKLKELHRIKYFFLLIGGDLNVLNPEGWEVMLVHV